MLRANETYNGTIEGANLIYSSGGTLGLQVHLDCEEGEISHTLWITDKTAERVEKTLTDLGVRKEDLQSEAALDNIGTLLAGKECSFNTVVDDYKGGIKVQWLNKPRKTPAIPAAKYASKLFAGVTSAAAPAKQSKKQKQPPVLVDDSAFGITDDDIPF